MVFYQQLTFSSSLQEDDEQLAAEVHKVLVAEGAIGVSSLVTSSAASASSTSRVSPPRRGRGGGWRWRYRYTLISMVYLFSNF